jgi:protein SCO1
LADARGGRLGTADLAGRPYAITFIYTHCKDVCPLIGEELRQSLAQVGPRASRTAVVAVSVDPKGDTVASVRRWLRRHHEPPNFHYLIGTAQELRPVWRAYYVAPQPAGEKRSAHTANVWLVDVHGRWRTKYSAGFPFNTRDLAHDLRALIDEASER